MATNAHIAVLIETQVTDGFYSIYDKTLLLPRTEEGIKFPKWEECFCSVKESEFEEVGRANILLSLLTILVKNGLYLDVFTFHKQLRVMMKFQDAWLVKIKKDFPSSPILFVLDNKQEQSLGINAKSKYGNVKVLMMPYNP